MINDINKSTIMCKHVLLALFSPFAYRSINQNNIYFFFKKFAGVVYVIMSLVSQSIVVVIINVKSDRNLSSSLFCFACIIYIKRSLTYIHICLVRCVLHILYGNLHSSTVTYDDTDTHFLRFQFTKLL